MAGAQHAAQSYCWVAQGPLLIQIAVHLPCNSDSAFVTPWITNPNFFRFPPGWKRLQPLRLQAFLDG